MRHELSAFIALRFVKPFLGFSSMTLRKKGPAIGGLGGEAAGGLVGSAVCHPVAGALVGSVLGTPGRCS
jgi:hypothetical protein